MTSYQNWVAMRRVDWVGHRIGMNLDPCDNESESLVSMQSHMKS